jgi:hypothetical protein
VNAMQLAALIAAGFFAVGVCAGVYVLIRLGRLIGTAGQLMADYRDRTDALIDRAQAAVDRSHEQLARTDAITGHLDQVSANMAELSTQVSALTSLARGVCAGLGVPLTKLAAVAYGIRHAVALRQGDLRAAAIGQQHAALAGQHGGITGQSAALHGRRERDRR